MPTRSMPSKSAQIAANCSSTACAGHVTRAPGRAAPDRAAGNARRSTLPLGVKGSRSSGTKAEGTMYSGRLARGVPPQLR